MNENCIASNPNIKYEKEIRNQSSLTNSPFRITRQTNLIERENPKEQLNFNITNNNGYIKQNQNSMSIKNKKTIENTNNTGNISNISVNLSNNTSCINPNNNQNANGNTTIDLNFNLSNSQMKNSDSISVINKFIILGSFQ